MRGLFVGLVGVGVLVLGACSGGTVENVEQSPSSAPAGCQVTSVGSAVVAQCEVSASERIDYSDYVTNTLNPWLAQQAYEQVADSSHVWIEAKGGQGALGNGDDCVHHAGKGGVAGYANTTRTSSELSGLTLYTYVGVGGSFAEVPGAACAGSSGGGSSMILTAAISDQGFDFDTNTLLVAGGGGGGSSQCDYPSVTGHAGGPGGVAIAGGGSDAVSEPGGNSGGGSGGIGGNSNQSMDGSPNGGGGGGDKAKDGVSGVGGFSGKTRYAPAVGWVNVDEVDQAAADWAKGAGGDSNTSHDSGASGAGGYGGGGGGSFCSDSKNPGGGGGGGSFASAGTIADPNIPTTYSGSQQDDHHGDKGKITMSWVLN